MSKNCIITTVKSKIKGNATSFIERETEIIIPVSNKFTLSQTRAMAQDKVNKINKEYLSEKFGDVVSLNTSYTDGTGINIHPSQLLIDAYEVKEGNKSIEELNPRNLDYFNGDEALFEQERNEDIQLTIDKSNQIGKEIENVEQQVQEEKTIKPGLSELFEQNPELANTVYEALGYNISNIDLKINRIGNRINVVTSSSNNKAQIDIDIEGKSAYITNTFVEKGQQGFGTLSYIKLGNELIKQGLILTSDLNGVDLQESGKALWESLVSKNLASYNPNIGRYVFSGQQALQIYSNYLDSLNKPNTNLVLQGNQEEQVKKFIELQERLNNKEFLEGAKSAYESSKGLQELGTQKEYNDYIARVSLGIIKNPSSGEYNYTSQVKDIVYHGTSNLEKVKNEGFKKSKLKTGEGTNLQGAGFYFAKFKQVLSNYAKGEKGGFLQAIVNLKNPLQERNFPEFLKRELNEENVSFGNVIEIGEKVDNWLSNNNKDGVIWNQISSFKEGTSEQETTREKLFGTAYNKNQKTLDVEHYSVKEPEQIHILSSKADIQGFKDYMAFQNSEFAKYGTYEQFRQFIMSKSSMEIENRIIETGKIDRVC